MTLADDITSHVSSVFLNTDHFAEEITKQLDGEPEDGETIDAIIHNNNTAVLDEIGNAIEFNYSGRIAEASSMTENDTVIIRTFRCRVVWVGKAQHGWKSFAAIRIESERTDGDALMSKL